MGMLNINLKMIDDSEDVMFTIGSKEDGKVKGICQSAMTLQELKDIGQWMIDFASKQEKDKS